MKNIVLSVAVLTVLTACGPSTSTPHFSSGGGGGGGPTAPDMDRLREVPTRPGETVTSDSTPNNSGGQGTNGGFNSSNPDEFGKPGKISG